METPASPKLRPSRDRIIAVAMVTLAALLASGWIMRERQWATDLAESREDLRQTLHRLQTLSASTDQIRSAYIQRKAELENTRKKLESATARTQEDSRGKTPSSGVATEKPKDIAAVASLMEKISQAKLPAWAAVEKSPTAVRVLPGVGVPAGNEGFSAFGSLASLLTGLDSTSMLELIGRAEPGNDAWETAQERAHRLLSSAEKSLKGQTGRIRLRIEVVKGPRMEWRILPADATPSANPEAKPTHK
ncbi:MAG: hypothetical protein EBU36_03125 [Verrucomicrobia bacterium]|jgi:hypothetical protein|nr:hypothetical protein [Verrucomicrobiota bacterium]